MEIDGEQYVVITTGGHGKMGVPTGDHVVQPHAVARGTIGAGASADLR